MRDLLARTLPMHAAAVAVLRGLREAEGVSLPAMLAETDRWAEAALSGAPDLDAMRRIVAVQSKRLSGKPRIVSPCR